MKIIKLIACLLGIITAPDLLAQTIYGPSEDAYVQGGANSGTNYNTAELVVKRGAVADYFREVYLKFNLSNAGLTSGDVGKAIVKLYLGSGGSYSIAAHKTGDQYNGTSTPWTESGLTRNNAPQVGASVYTSAVGTASRYYEWDITNYVKEQLNNNDPVISVVLQDNSVANLMASFNSKGASSNRPQLVIQAAANYSGTFYIDSQNGSDSNPGTQTAPWRTLDKANAGTFQPGSKILLKRGGVWSGQLNPKGSGSSANINTISAYGSGTAPVINGGGVKLAGVSLSDQEYWEISNLEITNTNGTSNEQGEIYGIYAKAAVSGVEYNRIHIKNNYIHNVNGNVGGKSTGGIFVEVSSTGQTRINNVLIEGNTIENVGGVGIQNRSTQSSRTKIPGTNGSYYPWENLVIRNNYINHIGRNGIIFRHSTGAIIEYNTVAFNSRYDTGHGIYNFGTDDGIVQFNEAYGNTGPGTDRGGFDADWDAYGSIIQYNYSHDNDWFCGIMRRKNENVDIRYNISQNEKEYTIFYGFDVDNELKNCRIYNNTFYVSSSISPMNAIKGTAIQTAFTNNIFYYKNATGLGNVSASTSFSHNLYFGVAPRSSDPNPVTSNPLLVNPGSGGTHINMTNPELLAGYKVQTGSPAIGAGKSVSNNGGRDYFGNSVSSGAAPNIGAYNGSGVGNTVTFPNPNNWYRLENKQSGKLLASDTQNSDVDLWSPSDNDSRQFRFVKSSAGGYWNIVSKVSGQYVANDVNTNEAKLWSAQDTDHRRWKVKPSAAGGYYLLESKVNGKYLSSDNTSNDAVLWSAQDTDYRRWKFIEAGSVNARTVAGNLKASDRVEESGDGKLTVYPNPSQGELYLRYQVDGSQKGSYRLIDILGKQHQAGLLDNQPGAHDLPLDVRSLPAGLYLLDVSVDGNVLRQRIVIK